MWLIVGRLFIVLTVFFNITFDPTIPSEEQEICQFSHGWPLCLQGICKKAERDPKRQGVGWELPLPILYWPLRTWVLQVQSLMIRGRSITYKQRRDSEIISKFKNRSYISKSDSGLMPPMPWWIRDKLIALPIPLAKQFPMRMKETKPSKGTTAFAFWLVLSSRRLVWPKFHCGFFFLRFDHLALSHPKHLQFICRWTILPNTKPKQVYWNPRAMQENHNQVSY